MCTATVVALALLTPTAVFAADGPPPPPPPSGGAPPPPPAGGGAPPPPPAGAPPAPAAAPAGPPPAPTAGLSGAEDAYNNEDFETAAIEYFKVVSGATQSPPGDVQRAQFQLGKSLYKLKFYSPALSIFDEIVQAGPQHPFHKLTLPWLASLSRELPEGAGVLEKIGTYDPSSLEDEAFDEVRDELYYLLGRFYYQKADFPQAIALLSQVPGNSDYYIPAQAFLGVAFTREFQAEPAVAAFKNVLRRAVELREAEEKKKKKDKRQAQFSTKVEAGGKKKRGGKKKASVELTFEQEMRNYEHLAAMGMSNVFYALGRFDTSLKYLDKIPLDSPYWLDSIHWSAWAEFRKVEVDPDNANSHYQRTLGHVHTLNAPFFDEYLYPDALKLKAVTYYFNCRYDSAKRTVDEFNRRYPETKTKLQQILDENSEDFALFDTARAIRAEESGLDPFVEQVALQSLQDKTLGKYFAYVDELETEQALLADSSGDFKSSGIGERVVEDLDLALSAARESTGAQARQRLAAQIKEIKDLEREMIKVEYEILEKRKAQKQLEDAPKRPQKPKIDVEHEIYNYNGEYWQDELGFYRYKVTNLCTDG